MENVFDLAANQWPAATLIAVAFIRRWIVAGHHYNYAVRQNERMSHEMVASIKTIAAFVKRQERRRR